MPAPPPDPAAPADAVQRAVEYGIDITLLVENLKYPPGERLRRGAEAIRSIMSFRGQVVRVREP